MFDDILDWIKDGWDDLFDINFSSSDILSSPRFWVPIITAGAMMWWVLGQWKDRVDGLTSYYLIGGVVIVIFAYFWAGRSIDKDG